jgi:GT2 family glycosyltransferase
MEECMMPSSPEVSIVMLSKDRLDFTRQALKTLQQYTETDHELIMIDNASTPQTFQWLEKQDFIDVLIRNKENLGFIKAANQGMRIARGKHIVLVNNDVIFTPNWLSKLLKPLKKNVGITTPLRFDGVTDQTVGKLIQQGFDMPQPKNFAQKQVSKINVALAYNKLCENKFNGKVHFTDKYVAFYCILINRDLIDKIGLLDERFGMGFAEDNDYCYRAFKAGFRIGVCLDTFVYHYGMITWAGIFNSNGDLDKEIRSKVKMFEEKWRLKP